MIINNDFFIFKVNRKFGNDRQSYLGTNILKSKAAQTELVNKLSVSTDNNGRFGVIS